MDDAELRAAVASREWYHTIELRPGLTTPGWFDTRQLPDRVGLPTSFTGQRCLDVGTFDGFWGFEMEARGADDVVAIDVVDPMDWDWPPATPAAIRATIGERHQGGGGWEIARAALGSRVRRETMTVYEVDPDRLGMFDFVYVGSLLIHLRDPIGALDRLRRVCRGRLLLVDGIDPWLTLRSPRRPLAALDGRDRPWWWRANQAAVERMVESAGFRRLRDPVRLTFPRGEGQPVARIRPRTLRTPGGREALVRSRIGDPHVSILAEPAV